VTDATIVITTKDRRADLRTALRSATGQRGADIEVLVIDDGSVDGTSELVRSEFPAVALHRNEQAKGIIGARNQAARLASGRVLVTIDDDAELSDARTVAELLEAFEHPRVGIVAMPHIHTRMDPGQLRDRAPDVDHVWCTWTFIGTAHALRRDAFLGAGGYREELITRVEEPDLCLRLLDRGLVCRLGVTPPILHHEHPGRSGDAINRMTARNELLEAWRNVPARALAPRLAGGVAHNVVLGARTRRPAAFARGLAGGMRAIARDRRREPVASATWRATRLLMRERAVRLDRLEPLLGPVA
jgi:glycosyltransferase involved in cell wall biosynthesis